MIVDVSDVLTEWERSYTVKTVEVKTVDFVPVETVTTRQQNCVVQVAEKDKLNPDTIDWSKEYLLVHSKSDLASNELIEFNGKDYRIIERGPWLGYGYAEVVAEETKEPLKVPTG